MPFSPFRLLNLLRFRRSKPNPSEQQAIQSPPTATATPTLDSLNPGLPPGDGFGAVRFLPGGDASLTVEFGSTVDFALSAKVLALQAMLDARPIPGVVETVPTLRSLTLHYDPVATSASDIRAALAPILALPPTVAARGRRWRLPACYDPDLGLDLLDVAAACGLTPDAVAAAHAATAYRVLMLGFMPGFPYMGELPAAIRLPRRATPRTHVPAGSIAIATTMSVVYTAASPGGWHVLGRTPAPLFDVRRTDPVLLAPGDEVVFEAISRDAYDRLAAQAAAGLWVPAPEPQQAAAS